MSRVGATRNPAARVAQAYAWELECFGYAWALSRPKALAAATLRNHLLLWAIAGSIRSMDEWRWMEPFVTSGYPKMREVCGKLNVPWQPARFGRYKSEYRRRSEAFPEYYTPQSAARVAQAFAWELEYFGYA